MPTDPDIARIAEGLTKAQRAAMVRPFWLRRGDIPCMAGNVDKRVKWALCLRRLLNDYLGAPSFTPLGLAVRAHLLASQTSGEEG